MEVDPYSRTQQDVQLADGLRDTLSTGPEAAAVVDLVASRLFSTLEIEAKIDRFELIDVVGSGGMGMVYAAHDPTRDEIVALKVVRPSAGAEAQPGISQARLLREAGVLTHLDHPNIVRLYESGIHDDNVFVVMEFIDGPTLDLWASAAPRSWQELVDIYARAGDGLAAAHARGLVHRDFKTQNVLVDGDGEPRVVDFGLARPIDTASFIAQLETQAKPTPRVEYSLTATGIVAGTPAYMAPELLTGGDATPSSDVYAFCTALLEVLSRDPQDSQTTPDVPGALIDALLRGIAAEPDQRWSDMDALLQTLRQFLRAEERKRRRPLWIALGIAVVVGVCIGLGLALSGT